MFVTALIAQEIDAGTWELFAPLIWDDGVQRIEVPTGFQTDFASAPRLLWWFCPPATGRHRKAAVLHDYLCVTSDDQPYADRMFLKAMEATGVPWWKRQAMFQAVRLYQICRGKYWN